MRYAVHFEFEGQGDQTFDFFGGVSGPLGDEFDLGWREVGVGVHWHALERQNSSDRDETGQHQDQELLA